MSAERNAQVRDGHDGALKRRLSPLHMLSSLGQSVWIDFLSRDSIRSGHVRRLMEGAGGGMAFLSRASTRSGHVRRRMEGAAVVGAPSNPTIFQKAMTAGSAYE